MVAVFHTLTHPVSAAPVVGRVTAAVVSNVILDDEQREIMLTSEVMTRAGVYVLALDVLPDDYYHLITHPDGEVVTVVVPASTPPSDEAHAVPGTDPVEYGWWVNEIRADNPTVPPAVTVGVASVTGDGVDNTDPRNPVITGGGGEGTVESVNDVLPDVDGNITLTAGDVGADTAAARDTAIGVETSARTAADTTLAGLITGEAATARAAESANATAVANEAVTARAAEALKLAKASNLSDLGNAATARTNLGLGTAAVAAAGDFDAAGAAATAQAAAIAASQPLDSDLTAIAALTTTSYGRSVLTQADAAALRTLAGLGTAATQATGAFDAAGAAAAAQAASQPLDSDLTAIAALSTTSFGRSVLTQADAAALRTLAGLGTAATSASTDFQPIDSDLTAIAALTTTSFGRSFLALADAAAARTLLALGTAAVVNTGTSSGDLPLLSTGGRLPIARIASGTPDGTKFVRDDGTLVTPSGGTSALTPTTTKTATYAAAVGDLAMMNVSGGGTTLTLPTAPADKSQVGIVAMGATSAVPLTISRGGSDTISTSGATSVALQLSGEVVIYQYDAGNTRWLAVSNVKGLTALDARYAAGPPLQLIETGASVYHLYDNGPVTTAALTVGKANTTQFPVDRACTLIGLAARVSSAAGAGGIIRLGLWADNGKGKPGVLILDSGTSLVSTSTGLVEATFSQALTPGMYHVGWVAQVAVCSMQVSVGTTSGSKITTNPANLLQFGHIGYEQNGVTGALPNPFVPVTNDGNSSSPNVPRIAVRIA